MKKILFVLSAWFSIMLVSLVFQSCYKSRCGEGGPGYANLASLDADLKQITGTEPGAYQGELLVISDADSTKALRYDSLLLSVTHNYSAMNKQQFQPIFGITAAYACDPVVHYENVREFIITSTGDYDSNHPAGTNLSDIMILRMGNTTTGTTLPEFIQNRNGSLNHNGGLNFSFSSPPTETGTQNITIKYILTNGKEFITPPVKALVRS